MTVRAEYGSARQRNPLHNGISRAIREALAMSSEPMSLYKLFLATGIKPERVSRLIYQMTGVVSLKGPKGVVFTLYEKLHREEKSDEPGAIGRGWYRAEFRPLKRDPFERMKLAMVTRGRA